jgi:hypothetical protein
VSPAQHAGLTAERWAQFTIDQQVLMIANEMHRAGKLFAPEDQGRRRTSYERVLRLADLTSAGPLRKTLRRELRRWREVVAALYAGSEPDPAGHAAAYRVLLTLTPQASRQLSPG